jgi:hypothetical protein
MPGLDAAGPLADAHSRDMNKDDSSAPARKHRAREFSKLPAMRRRCHHGAGSAN